MSLFQYETHQYFTNLARKFYQEYFLDAHWLRVKLEIF